MARENACAVVTRARRSKMKTLILTALTLAPLFALSSAQAHRSGCHRWHSCESDRATYTCGDTGHSNYCDTPTPSSVAPAVVVQPTALVLDGPIKFRASPSRKGKILFQLPTGGVVNLGLCGKDWCAVGYGKSRGWMMKKFLKAQ